MKQKRRRSGIDGTQVNRERVKREIKSTTGSCGVRGLGTEWVRNRERETGSTWRRTGEETEKRTGRGDEFGKVGRETLSVR